MKKLQFLFYLLRVQCKDIFSSYHTLISVSVGNDATISILFLMSVRSAKDKNRMASDSAELEGHVK